MDERVWRRYDFELRIPYQKFQDAFGIQEGPETLYLDEVRVNTEFETDTRWVQCYFIGFQDQQGVRATGDELRQLLLARDDGTFTDVPPETWPCLKP